MVESTDDLTTLYVDNVSELKEYASEMGIFYVVDSGRLLFSSSTDGWAYLDVAAGWKPTTPPFGSLDESLRFVLPSGKSIAENFEDFDLYAE